MVIVSYSANRILQRLNLRKLTFIKFFPPTFRERSKGEFFLKIIFAFFFSLTGLILILNCSKKFTVKPTDPFLFQDGIAQSPGIQLFTILDSYPSLKSGFSKLDPPTFNNKLNESLNLTKDNIAGSLRSLENLLLQDESKLRPMLSKVSLLLNRMRTGNPESYSTALSYLTRIRNLQQSFLISAMPITNRSLKELYKTKSNSDLQKSLLKLNKNLVDPSLKDTLKSLENFIYKGISLNTVSKQGLAKTAFSLLDYSQNSDKKLKNALMTVLNQLGDSIALKGGYDNSKKVDYAIKEFLLNLQKYNTSSGSEFTSSTYGSYYNNSTYSSEFSRLVSDIFVYFKKIINTPSNLLLYPDKSLLGGLLENYNKLGFTGNYKDVDLSLRKVIALDPDGKDRATNGASKPISALESLVFLLSLSDNYGYIWNNDPINPQITGMSGGIITLGDAMYALYSRMNGSPLGIFDVLNKSASSANTNGYVKRNGVSYPVNANTPALSLLEGESRGPISGSSDSVFTKTIPWVLAWISKSLYSGYSPYYNKNRKDSSGNFLTIDGNIYKDSKGFDKIYKSFWKTSEFSVTIKNGTRVGLGGYKDPQGDGIAYTIQEIEKTDTERAVDTDEEAFYKNFQWLLYEKKFVLVTPVQVNLDKGIQDAIYLTIIANGLKGLMNVKPFCGTNDSEKCYEQYSGIWRMSERRIKSDIKVQGDLTRFSDTPGDSCILIESWGYGISSSTYGFSDDTTFQQVYRLLYSQYDNPDRFYGAIPKVISQNFSSLERIGFTNGDSVSPSKVKDNWNSRNKLLPLIAALANTLYVQSYNTSDPSQSKNPFKLITDLFSILARPYVYSGNDPVAYTVTNENPTSASINIINMKIKGASSDYGIRSRSMSAELYYPDENLRSLMSLLIENNRRYSDGVIYAVSGGNLVSSALELLSILGSSEKTSARENLIKGLQLLVSQVGVNSDNPSSTQFNIESSLKDISDKISKFLITRSANPADSSWDDITDLTDLLNDILSKNSPYEIVTSLSSLMDILIEGNASESEMIAFLNILSQALTSPQGSQNYILSEIITTDLPSLIPPILPYSRSIIGILDALSVPNTGFFYWLQACMKSDYHISNMFLELEKFSVDPVVQSVNKDNSSMFYATGTLMKYFADIYQFGKKFADPGNYNFEDRWNVTEENSTLYDRVNYILSKKK